MAGPIAFISHFRVKEGKVDAFRQRESEVSRVLRADKPRTLVFLTYLNQDATAMTVVHVFADPESMDLHFQGSEERSKAVRDFLEPQGWEIYGGASDAVLLAMREAAASAGVPLRTWPDYVGGFLRPAAPQQQ